MKQIKNCSYCQKLFEKRISCSKKEWMKTKFCSRFCGNKGRVYIKERYKFPKGNVPWNKGLDGVCNNTGRTHIKKGQRLSPKTEFEKGIIPKTCFKKGDKRISGANNNHWKGGITPENLKIRWSQDMKNWRVKVFKRDNYTCQECGQRGGNLNADHIKSFSLFPELRLALDNGRTLCVDCHKKTKTYGRNTTKYSLKIINLMR